MTAELKAKKISKETYAELSAIAGEYKSKGNDALTRECRVATRNQAHFSRISDLEIITP